jgi:hypothetical protein
VHPNLRRYQNLLLHSDVGVNLLNANSLTDAIGKSGLARPCSLSDAPAWFQDPTLRSTLGRCVANFVSISSDHEREHTKQLFRDCVIAPASDGWVKHPSDLYVADAETLAIFIPFVRGDDFVAPDCPQAVSELADSFTVSAAVNALESVPEEDFTDIWHDDPDAVINLIRWFAARSADLQSDADISARLANLPIWPSSHSLHPLSELSIPAASFTDPLELANVADMSRLNGLRDFLVSLDASELSILTYARDQIPLAFEDNDISPKARQDLLKLLAKNVGELQGHPEIKTRLTRLPLVECRDGTFARANEAYFDTANVHELLGSDTLIASLPSDPTESATVELFLRWLEVASDPRPEDIVRRIKVVTSLRYDQGFDAIQHIFIYLARSWTTTSDTDRVGLAPLIQIEWLPGSRDERWHKPSTLYAAFNRSLFESQADILKIDVRYQQEGTDFLKYLGVSGSPPTVLIVRHLLYCAEHLIDITKQVYQFLNYDVGDPSILTLRGKPCIWLRNGLYILPSHAFWDFHGFGRYRTQLGADWREFTSLFTLLGVRERPGWKDALDVLSEVALEFASTEAPLTDEVFGVALECWRLLSIAFGKGQITEEHLSSFEHRRVIPDGQRILKRPHDLFFEDRPGLTAHFQDVLHTRIISYDSDVRQAMAKAGVRPISKVVHRTLVDRGHTIPTDLTSLIADRFELIARVLETHDPESTKLWDLDMLYHLQIEQASNLQVIYTFYDGSSRHSTAPQAVSAYYNPEQTTLFFQIHNPSVNTPPWPAIARELASALNPLVEPGLLTNALKDVLSATSVTIADAILDELGYAPRRAISAPPPVATVISLGSDDVAAPEYELRHPSSPQVPDLPTGITATQAVTPENGHAEFAPGLDNSDEGHLDPPSTHPPSFPHLMPALPDHTQPSHKARPPRSRSGRRVTYAIPPTDAHDASDSTPHDTQLDRAIEQAGIEHVLAYEKDHNRKAKEMPTNHPGYDIESIDESDVIRYIEVKSAGADWNDYGVALSDTQFTKARELGSQYWLYVVEHARSDDAPIYRI